MSKEKISQSGKAGKKGKGKRVSAVSPPPAPASKLPFLKGAQPSKPRPVPPVAPAAARPASRPAIDAQAQGEPWSISLEAALYVLLVGLALAARLFALDRFPLQPAEGVSAWAAWGILHGRPDVAFAGQSPLPVFAASLSYLLFGDSDVSARFIPALAGGLCVALPYALRRELGRAGALVAAALLAFGPTFMFVSRSLDGGMIVAAGSLVLLACALRYRQDEDVRCIYISAVTLGAMFAADRTAGPVAVILGLLAVFGWQRSDVERTIAREALRNGVLLFIGAAVVLGAGLFSNVQGLQAALIDPLTAWFSGAASGTLGERVGYYGRALLAYEPLVVVFALAGALAALAGAWQRRRQEPNGDDDEQDDGDGVDAFSLTPYLVAWALLSLAFYVLASDRSSASLVQVLVPLALLAAQFIGSAVESAELWAAGKDVWLLAFVVVLIAFAIVPWLNPSTLFGGRFSSLEKRIQTLMAVILAALMIGMVAVAVWYALRLRLKATLLAIGTAVGVALAVFTLHSAWQLNHVEWAGATEPVLMQRTAQDVRLLLNDVFAISRTQGDDAIAITLDDRIGQPARWYLRRFLNVTTARAGATTKTPVVIVPAAAKDAMAKSLGAAYVNQRYRLSSTWSTNAPLLRWLRWAHVRDLVNPPIVDDVIAFYKLPQ